MKLLLVALLAFAPLLAQDDEPEKRLHESAAVFSEIMAATDTSIPQDLLTKAHCIVIVPGLKTAAFVFGGNTARVTCLAGTRAAKAGRRRVRSALRAAVLASRSVDPQRI